MLTCEECGRSARTETEARHWRAYLCTSQESDRAARDVAVYCPECAEREFGRGASD